MCVCALLSLSNYKIMTNWRSALQQYIQYPERYTVHNTNDDHSISTVVFYDEHAAIITDGYPKSTEHLLILPRSRSLTHRHPATALTEKEKTKLEPYIDIALKYIYDSFSTRYEILDETINNRTTFTKDFIQVGVHMVPSMNNMHIHVITRDFNSSRLKNKKHYNTFNTDFFVPWERLPLPISDIEDSNPRDIETRYLKQQDLLCCYCGRNLGNKFTELKKHLKVEFDKRFIEKQK